MPFIVADPAPPPLAPVLPSPLTDMTWSNLPEYVREADDGTLLSYLGSAASQSDKVMTFLSDPVLSTDPARCTFDRIEWLAALAGVDISSVPTAERRSWLMDPDNRLRGNVETIRRRVGVTLTGARQVWVASPHLGDPDRIYVLTLAAETPDADATLAAIRAEIPAWMQLTAEVAAGGITYNALAALYPTYDDMTSTGKTYHELTEG